MGELANAEEWARWAAVHDDWDKTRALMGVLLVEYDRRGAIVEAATALVEKWYRYAVEGSDAGIDNEVLFEALENALRRVQP